MYVDLAFVGLRLLWCLRFRPHHPCLGSNATLWKHVSSFNLAIWSVRSVLVHLTSKFILDTFQDFQDSTSTSNQSGWKNCLGCKRLRFRWQHPESKDKLDAVTLSHGFPKGHLSGPTSKMLQSRSSTPAPIVPLPPTSSVLLLGHSFSCCRLLLDLKLQRWANLSGK